MCRQGAQSSCAFDEVNRSCWPAYNRNHSCLAFPTGVGFLWAPALCSPPLGSHRSAVAAMRFLLHRCCFPVTQPLSLPDQPVVLQRTSCRTRGTL